MEENKRKILLSTAMGQFSKNGYKKTTTDEIIGEAEISKGLLFHYFGTKKDLYLFLFEYAVQTVMKEYFEQINLLERDILERLRNSFLLKFKLTVQYPAIFDFISSAYFEKDPAVATTVNKYANQLYIDTQAEILKNIDLSLFREDISSEKVIHIIFYTLRGYSDSQTIPGKKIEDYNKELDRYNKDIDEYIKVLRAALYKEMK